MSRPGVTFAVRATHQQNRRIGPTRSKNGDRGFGLCASCQLLGACQLGITEMRREGPESMRAIAACPPGFTGASDVAHGGWIAATFDDFLGQLSVLHGQLHVTASLGRRRTLP